MDFTVFHLNMVCAIMVAVGLPFMIRIFLTARKLKKEHDFNVYANQLMIISLIFTGSVKNMDKDNRLLKSLRKSLIWINVLWVPLFCLFIYILLNLKEAS